MVSVISSVMAADSVNWMMVKMTKRRKRKPLLVKALMLMVLLEMVQKIQRLPKMVTLKCLRHQASKIELRIMMMVKIKSRRAANSQRNRKYEDRSQNRLTLFIMVLL